MSEKTMPAVGIETVGMTKIFGSLVALEDASIHVPAGTFHALLGENGAGKSTLVKCIMGFYQPTRGKLIVDGTEEVVKNPRDAMKLKLGMVYQHFTLVPSLTAAENLVISRADCPAVVDWRTELGGLEAFLDRMPFKVPLKTPVSSLSAGEKQKLEILKQLYLDRRFLILDEPTSVLTPGEADEILGLLRDMTKAGELTILMISHKFREVNAYCDAVSVLRRGRYVGGGEVKDLTTDQMAHMMIGDTKIRERAARTVRSEDTTCLICRRCLRLTMMACRRWNRSISRSRPARSSASPGSPATASRNSLKCSPASAISMMAASSSTASRSSRRASIWTSSRSSVCPRNR